MFLFYLYFCKDNANREQNKMNLFIFYGKVQLIFAFSSGKDKITIWLYLSLSIISFTTFVLQEYFNIFRPLIGK